MLKKKGGLCLSWGLFLTEGGTKALGTLTKKKGGNQKCSGGKVQFNDTQPESANCTLTGPPSKERDGKGGDLVEVLVAKEQEKNSESGGEGGADNRDTQRSLGG